MLYDLIFKELTRRKLRTVLTVMGVAIGILLVVSLSSFSEGITIFVNKQISQTTGMVSVIQSGISFQAIFSSEVDVGLVDEFASIPGVEDTSGFIMGIVPGVGFVGGVDFDKTDMFSQTSVGLDDGRWPERGADEIVVGFTAKDRLGVVVGDSVKINGKDYTVVGISEETGSSDDDDSIMTSIETAQDMLDKEGKVTMIMVKPFDVADAKDIANQINEDYGDAEDVVAGTDEDVRKFAAQMTGQLSAMTFGLGSIASAIAGIVIMNVMFMAVRERRREIGVMKAIGATNRQILLEIIAEAVLISLFGAAIGLLLSFGSVGILNSFLGTGGLAVITPNLAVEAVVFAVVIGILAGAAPARQAEKLSPVEAIRYE